MNKYYIVSKCCPNVEQSSKLHQRDPIAESTEVTISMNQKNVFRRTPKMFIQSPRRVNIHLVFFKRSNLS